MTGRRTFILVALLLTCGIAVAKDAPKLPDKAQAARAKYERDVAKAKAEYDKQVQVALKPYLAALDEAKKQAVRAGDLDAAQAIKKVVDDLSSPPMPPPPDEAKAFGQHRYLLYAEPMTWADAAEFCKQKGGRLACPTDKPTSKFVQGLVRGDTWIGGVRDGTRWAWVDGRPVEFTDWHAGEPNNVGGRENRIAFTAAGGWLDVADTKKLPFVCEW